MSEPPEQLTSELIAFEREFRERGYSLDLQRRFWTWERDSLFAWADASGGQASEIVDSGDWLSRRLSWAGDGLTVEVLSPDESAEAYARITAVAKEMNVDMLGREGAVSRKFVVAWR